MSRYFAPVVKVSNKNGFMANQRVVGQDVEASPPQLYTGRIHSVWSDGTAMVDWDYSLNHRLGRSAQPSSVRDPRTTPLGVRWRARDECQQRGSAEICGHLPRKQRVVVVNGPRQRKTLEQPVKVAIGIDAPGFAGFDQAVEVCTCVRPRYGVAKKP